MKVLMALLALVAVGNSLPAEKEIIIPVAPGVDTGNPRIIEGIISSVIEDISTQIRDRGFDPFTYEGFHQALGLPVPILFDLTAFVDNAGFTGLSNIVINHINYGILSSRLTLDISLPHIELFVDEASFDVTVLGEHFKGQCRDLRIGVIEAGISGIIEINIGIISGISIRNINLEFDLDRITFGGHVSLLENDLTSDISNFVTVWLPDTLHKLRYEINQLIDIIAWEVAGEIL